MLIRICEAKMLQNLFENKLENNESQFLIFLTILKTDMFFYALLCIKIGTVLKYIQGIGKL